MISFDKIEALLFDYGGVIINLNYQATIRKFHALGVQNFTQHFSKAKQSEFFAEFERGNVTRGFFFQEMKKLAPRANELQILEAWNALLLDIPPKRIQILKKLKKKFTMYMLSNNNELHYEALTNYVYQEFGTNHLHPFFDKIYLSHEIRKRKPDSEAFIHVIEDAGIDPTKTLFIEDSPQHIETAKSLGFRTYHVAPGKEMEVLFEELDDLI